jgi:uncharacterized protein (TIGR00369 family)
MESTQLNPEQLNSDPFPFARLLGIEITRSEADLVEAEMTVREEFCTAGDILHGGAAMALADTLGGVATLINLPEGAKGTATIESKTNFVSSAPAGGKVIGRSTPVHKGRRTQVWQTRLETEEGKLVSLTVQTQIVLS